MSGEVIRRVDSLLGEGEGGGTERFPYIVYAKILFQAGNVLSLGY